MDISNSPVDGVGQTVEPIVGQATTNEVKVVPVEDYTNAVAFGTTARQNEIALAKRLVEKDKSEIKNVSDIKVRDKIAKDLFGYADYSEMVAIEGEDFGNSSVGADDDELTNLKKQVRLLSYQSEKGQLENAISQYIEKNPSLFTRVENIEKLRSSINLISGSLQTTERVRMAGQLLQSEQVISSDNLALKAIASMQPTTSGNGNEGVQKADDKNKSSIDALASFLKMR